MTLSKEGTESIKLVVYFHRTQGKDFKLPPKMAYKAGRVYMPTNHKHGIRASDVKENFFFSKSQGSLMDAISDCLKGNGVKLVKDDKIKDFKILRMLQEKSDQFFDTEMKNL